ncbi:DASH family cryptochrome [Enterovibrio sp. ZSDZ35]|uniref:Cryptochrome DASH n=1 Tax=Enterovibrio qingdaonensis TaxID=2899818 RepID=A0ABT5QJS0_9GAMM|nr:DASH family cryptochrome [Enterovibrio sp. ZSDZ35]MDD1780854.1 DASH family cryptochrome [Enterovibrio sp. ZSDZ35]
MNGLYWFRHDLRLADNPALVALSKRCNQALMLYVIDPSWFKPNHFQSRHLGRFREEFLYQSLRALEKELKKSKQRLVVKVGNPLEIIPKLCEKHQIDLVATTEHPGFTERQQLGHLSKILPCEVMISESFTLFIKNQISFTKDNFPASFAEFKATISAQNLLPCIPIAKPDSLPPAIDESRDLWGGQEFVYDLTPYHGGEDSGFVQLNQFFWKTQGLKNYKDTRNRFDGWQCSSRLSAWLSNGTLSVRTVAAELDNYEYRYGKSPSTEMMYSELLYREYFQWMMHFHGKNMFAFDGIKKKRPLTSFYCENYKAWEQGTTDCPLVNACMRQLNQTGYMSSKGRQIVARYLVNTLNVDWRFGAAYFEQQLVDFDVATNYGNWQYLSGVSADSEHLLPLDIDKLAREYDPDGSFIAKWAESSPSVSLLRF